MNEYQIEVHSHAIRYVDKDGALLAEVTFPDAGGNTVAIDRTFVDESLRGQGIASKLLAQAAQELEETGRKAKPVCSYAVRWFEQHPEKAHLLA